MTHSTTPGGEPVVDILIDAYNGASRPNPFAEISGKLIQPRTPEADLLRGRIGAIAFSPYWGERFQDFRDGFNGNPAGFFAQEIFHAAETQDGQDLLQTVARELGDKHPTDVLEAEIDLPGIKDIRLDVPRLSSLAAFLLERRELLGAGIINLKGAKDISDSWIQYAHALVVQDVDRHDALLAELVPAYVKADSSSRKIMDEWEEGMMGGYDQFNHVHALSRAIAGILGKHLPEIVVSRLTKAETKTEDPEAQEAKTAAIGDSRRELSPPARDQ